MADDTTSQDFRPRSAGGRDAGGFRIRLSDNEMRAARALQEAFGLRSTVAVLGFALRTLAQQLEDGQLQELVAQQREAGGSRESRPRVGGGERGGGGERRRERGGDASPRVNPMARPARPVRVAEPDAEAVPDAEAGLSADAGLSAQAEPSPEADPSPDAVTSHDTDTLEVESGPSDDEQPAP